MQSRDCRAVPGESQASLLCPAGCMDLTVTLPLLPEDPRHRSKKKNEDKARTDIEVRVACCLRVHLARSPLQDVGEISDSSQAFIRPNTFTALKIVPPGWAAAPAKRRISRHIFALREASQAMITFNIVRRLCDFRLWRLNFPPVLPAPHEFAGATI